MPLFRRERRSRDLHGAGGGNEFDHRMLFNTPEFIFLFLPFAVVLHFSLARWSIEAAIAGTTVSSLVFYAWWNPPFILLPALSIAANFWLARRMLATDTAGSRRLLILGIGANLLVLCYYKYADFLLSIVHGTKAAPPNVPLALSFTTFVQIAFLTYVHQRRSEIDLRRYALFVAFFPHLIAGPIVRWGSFGRQLYDASRYRPDWTNIALGLTIFTLGLAKKVLIADPLSPHVGAVFDAAARGEAVTGFAAWAGATAFSLQIFFDFSGYSDMAVGLGLLFNFRLPVNFAAPLRATSMFDLWRRWHITLSRLARDLIYVPLALRYPGTALRAAALMLTMVVIGVWHGAGWTFVAWGAFHGVLLLVNQFWRWWRGPGRATRAGRLAGWALTFTAFVIGAVFFRAADMDTAGRMLVAMAGFGNATAPEHLVLGWDGWMIRHGYLSEAFVKVWFGAAWTMVGTLWTALAFAVAMLVPDTMEITGYREGDAQSNWRRPVGILAWQPSALALGATVIVFVAVFASIGRVSEFLYYQF
jgi:D-alanyl-lipoteichoic acid acyltransferase DltB (MBOAT superfamily)